MPYVKSNGVFLCPDDTWGRGTKDPSTGVPPIPCSYSESLVWNDWPGSSGGVTNTKKISATGANESEITSPSTTIFLSERWNWYHFIGESWAQDNWCNDGESWNLHPGSFHGHSGGSNYAFVDGHTKWMHIEQTM